MCHFHNLFWNITLNLNKYNFLGIQSEKNHCRPKVLIKKLPEKAIDLKILSKLSKHGEFSQAR